MNARTSAWALAVVIAASVALAWWAFPRAVEDRRFQLAGMANALFGRPDPMASIVLGLVVTGLAVVVALDARRRGHRVARHILAPLVVGWLAYAAGTGLVLASGGQTTYTGSLQYTFSDGIDHAESIEAVCRSSVGQPTVLADVDPDARRRSSVRGLPVMRLRHPATGAPFAPDVERFEPFDGTILQPFAIPTLADRPKPYMEVIVGSDKGHREPPIGVLDAYDFAFESVDDKGMTGSAVLSAKRWHAVEGGEVRWVDLTMPDDPWPETFSLALVWACRS
jgi:hypothetical protein